MADQQESSHKIRFVRCVISDEIYCIRMSKVRSIVNTNEVDIQLDTSQKIGLLSRGDEQFPVINLERILQDRGQEGKPSEKILVFNADESSFGLLVVGRPKQPIGLAHFLDLRVRAQNPAILGIPM